MKPVRKFGTNLQNLISETVWIYHRSKKLLQLKEDTDSALSSCQNQVRVDHFRSLLQQHDTESLSLPQKYLAVRYDTAHYILNFQQILVLKQQTIEHAIFLLDKISTIPNHSLFSDLKETQLTALTVLFISCKYRQIYSPSMIDILGLIGSDVKFADVIVREKEILDMVKFNIRVTLISDFYSCQYLKQAPQEILRIIKRNEFVGFKRYKISQALYHYMNQIVPLKKNVDPEVITLTKMMHLLFVR